MREREYERFTGPARLDRDMHILEGIIRGITLDGPLNSKEASALLEWCSDHDAVIDRHPFDELIPKIRAAFKEGVLDEEEREDLLWLCRQVRTPNVYYSVATADMQRLQGLLVGIAADAVITEGELHGIGSWLESVQHLRGTWPYDEIDALITGVLADGKIDAEEHRFLLHFCREFLDAMPSLLLEAPFNEEFVRFGICAATPEIVFRERRFCFTGYSPGAERKHLEGVVTQLGGTPHPRVTKDLDYLVVGAEGNRCWAFSCYGRKVEAAMGLRKTGGRITIVHENDFWDAAEDSGVSRPRL